MSWYFWNYLGVPCISKYHLPWYQNLTVLRLKMMGKCVLVLAPTTLFVGGCYGVLVFLGCSEWLMWCFKVFWWVLWCSEWLILCCGHSYGVLRSNYGVLGVFLWCSDWLLWCFGSGCSDQDFFSWYGVPISCHGDLPKPMPILMLYITYVIMLY